MEESQKKLTVIVPVYNEKESISQLLNDLIAKINDGEIIVVDDGSTDGTKELLETYKDKVSIIHHRENSGYGSALKSGLKLAKTDYIAIIDADGTYPVTELIKLWEKIKTNNYDMVVGERKASGKADSFFRKLARNILHLLAAILTKKSVPDINSGLRIFKKELALKYLPLLPDGFSFTTTITLCLLCNHFSIAYFPIEYQVRTGKSKIKPLNDMYNFLLLIIRSILFFHPLRILLPLSMLFFVLATFVVIISKVFLGQVMDVTATVLYLLSVQTLVLGLLADLIVKRLP